MITQDDNTVAEPNGSEYDKAEVDSPTKHIELSYQVLDKDVGTRLDKMASLAFDGFSRVQLQGYINDGSLLVNQATQKPKYAVRQGDVLSLLAAFEDHSNDLPENITLDIVYEDDHVIIINKPAGMVVHPGAGNRTGTLVNALLYHYPDNAHLPRAGLVHRIDKDTTGLLVVAKTKSAQLELTNQLKDKSVYRHYQCIVSGTPADILRHALIDAPIGRHSTQRTKMAVKDSGKPAVTHIVRATALSDTHSLLDVRLETGRTHQIRVHLSHKGFPLVGDKVYGSPTKKGTLTTEQRQAIQDFPRQALHAHTLGFIHPATGDAVEFFAPLPSDIVALIHVFNN
ncbi:RluA family pseudouridine synthase [Moraxella nasovis]|uniref:RluA family pseudouridine synthase n=1 Tax=Moraxella nasovis TaxID=2904121 RepID=UPI001F613801|nr:RluA family pseudouridine synthase [Moraxella nasovis]UNU73399.1 RluA family pseudouridine synthase [Moraxella nasovis]